MLKKLLNIFKSKSSIQLLYPELEIVGGLQNAIDIEFKKLNSILRVSRDSQQDNFPFTFARIESGQKFSQVSIGGENKIYLSDFWKEGVCLAHGQTKSITELGQVLNFWFCNDITTNELADQFPFVVPNNYAFAFDNNSEIEYKWNIISQDHSRKELIGFVEHAMKDDVLNKLFPFTSLYTLCFSSRTGYPYDTTNLPNVTPKQFEHFVPLKIENRVIIPANNTVEAQFIVTKNNNEYLGQGNAEEALRIVKANLPDNVQPARKGTAND